MTEASPKRYVSKGFSLTPAMVKELRRASRERGWNESMIARDAIRMWLDRFADEKKPKEQAS